jgi:hypothetical protein
VTDDLEKRLAATDPLADAHPGTTPVASRLDAIKERTVSRDPLIVTRTLGRVRRPVVLGLAAALLVGGATVVAAVLGPITFQPAGAAVAGRPYFAKGSGCAANAAVSVTLDGRQIGIATSDASGLFSVSSQIPAGTSLGTHQLRSSCVDGSGKPLVQTVAIEVVASVPDPTYPPSFATDGAAVAGGAHVEKGSGCAANAAVTVTLDGRQVGTTIAEATGEFAVTSQIPVGTSLGSHQLEASCADAAGKTLVQTAEVSVVADAGSLTPKILPTPGTLP